MNFFRSLVVPDVQGHLLVDEGEVIIDEVRKHWAATFWWYALASLGIPLLLAALGAEALWWGPVLLGVAVIGVGLWKVHVARMDRFVITNMRVFRVHGVFDRSLATMPMTRMGIMAVMRDFFYKAKEYMKKKEDTDPSKQPDQPDAGGDPRGPCLCRYGV